MIKIGITGSLASGKTTVSKILSHKRGPLFSADQAVKEIYKAKDFRSLLSKKFNIKNNNLIKRSLKKIILANKNINFRKLLFDKGVSKISIIGVGMITTPGITYRMFQALASKKINILVISTSEIKISVLISSKSVKKAVAVLHKEFKLD